MFHKERAKSLTEDSTNKIINKNDSSCKTPDFWNGGHRKDSVKLESSSGYAKVSLVGENGGRASKSDYNADSSGWLDSLWATVESTDYATSVTHSGSTGSTSHYYTAG